MKPRICFKVTITAEEYTRVRNSEIRLDKLISDKLRYIRQMASEERVKRMFLDDDFPDTLGSNE